MEDFDVTLKKSTGYAIMEAEQSFTNVRENAYQKKTLPLKQEATKYCSLFFAGVYALNALTSWRVSLVSKIYELTLVGLLIYLVSKKFDLFQKKPVKRGRPQVGKAATKGKSQDMMFSPEMLLIVALHEYNLAGEIRTVQLMILELIPSVFIHFIFTDKLNPAKQTVLLRVLINVLSTLLNFRTLTWKDLIVCLVQTGMMHLMLVNSLHHINKLVRRLFAQYDIQTRYFNQTNSLFESIPYPIIVFDHKEKENESDRNLFQVIYFNVEGSELISQREKTEKDESKQDLPINFLDLLDPQDECQVIDTMDIVKQGRETKATFTTDLPKELLGEKQNQRYDITIWKLNWQDRIVYAAMFSSDNYVNTKGGVRFFSKYLEGLMALLKQSAACVEVIIGQIVRLNSNKIDSKAFVNLISKEVTDLMCSKYLVDNCTIFEPYVAADAWKVFNIKAMIIGVTDIMSKDLNQKGLEVSLAFTQDFPNTIRARLVLLRSFFFDLFKYLERRINTGRVFILCDEEQRVLPNQAQEDVSSIWLKFTMEVSAVKESELPPSDFLNTNQFQEQPIDSKTFEATPIILLSQWLNKLRAGLDMTVDAHSLTHSNTAKISRP